MADAGGAPALAALRNLAKALEANEVRSQMVRERASEIERLREQGYSWRDIVATEERPLLVEILTRNMAVVVESGSQFRRIEARMLHQEGLKAEEIADLFGVSPEHVSAMLAE